MYRLESVPSIGMRNEFHRFKTFELEDSGCTVNVIGRLGNDFMVGGGDIRFNFEGFSGIGDGWEGNSESNR